MFDTKNCELWKIDKKNFLLIYIL